MGRSLWEAFRNFHLISIRGLCFDQEEETLRATYCKEVLAHLLIHVFNIFITSFYSNIVILVIYIQSVHRAIRVLIISCNMEFFIHCES